MSCWICSNEFIAVLSLGIKASVEKNTWLKLEKPYDWAEDFGGRTFVDEYRLYKSLKALNIAAYEGRYGKNPDEAEDYGNMEAETKLFNTNILHLLKYDPTGKAWGAMLKMFECYLYQISEDPVYGSVEFKDLERIRDHMEHIVVGFNAGYNNARWGDVPDELKAC